MENPVAWYAVRTLSRTEKKVVERLKEKGIEAYVPLKVEKRKWSDRIKTIETPLITCYVFVHMALDRRIDVLRTQGVVGYVKEEHKDVQIPDQQMQDFIKAVSHVPEKVDFTPQRLKEGTPIIVKCGPLAGMKGEMMEYAGSKRIIIRLSSIGCARVEIEENSVEEL